MIGLGLDPRTSSVLRKRDNQLHHPTRDTSISLIVELNDL